MYLTFALGIFAGYLYTDTNVRSMLSSVRRCKLNR